VFNNLLESHATTEHHAGGHALSVVLHACVIATAIVLTQRVVTAAAPEASERIDFVAPAPPPPPPMVAPRDAPAPAPIPLGHQVLVAPIVIPDVLPAIDLTRPITDARDYLPRGVAGGRHDGDSTVIARPRTGEATYFAAQVEKPAAQVAGTGTPDYPDMLRSAGISGEVRVQFVVDTTGRAEMSTFKVLKSGHAQFSEAVRKALAKMLFKPAEMGSQKVRQIVEMPFVFSLR
jgi:protein TonB